MIHHNETDYEKRENKIKEGTRVLFKIGRSANTRLAAQILRGRYFNKLELACPVHIEDEP
jgi:hypothetical protein